MSFIVKGQTESGNIQDRRIAFADYLFNTRQYEFAAQEYIKLSYQYPENPLLKKRVLESFRLSNDKESGLYFSKEFFVPGEESTLEFYPEILKLRILTDRPVLNPSFLIDTTQFKPVYYESLLLDYMLSLNWEEVKNNAGKIRFSPLYPFTENTPENEYLSPFLAAGMSAIIPGSGKVYAKRWRDGLSSLLFVGITAFQSYRGFSQGGSDSVYGWIMGGLSFSFYLGNIYGSVKATKDYNHNLNDRYKEEIIDFYIYHY